MSDEKPELLASWETATFFPTEKHKKNADQILIRTADSHLQAQKKERKIYESLMLMSVIHVKKVDKNGIE